MKLTVLMENRAGDNPAIKSEHGFSVYIETPSTTLLFDTGASGAFLENASLMGIQLEKVEHLILSHGHYDHTGGVMPFFDSVKTHPTIHVGKGFFSKRYHDKIDQENRRKSHYIGNSFTEEALTQTGCTIQVETRDVYWLTEEVALFTGFPLVTAWEPLNTDFKSSDGGNEAMDAFNDEIALGIRTEAGLVVLLGCAHRGAVNMVTAIAERTDMPLRAVIGGTHLKNASEERIDATIQALQAFHLEMLGVCHCTGKQAGERMKAAFGSAFSDITAGTVLEWDD